MDWLKEIFKRIFFRNKIKLLEEPKVVTEDFESKDNNFFINLRRQADLEIDDGNGYKIIPNMKLKDMV